MNNQNIILIISACVVALLAIILAIMFSFAASDKPQPVISNQNEEDGAEELSFDVEQQIPVVLLFQTPADTRREVPIERQIFNMISIDQQASQVLQQLIEGPLPGEPALSTIPRRTKLLRFYISPHGIAYAVFSEELAKNHTGGSSKELMTVYSIVNTLCVNFPSIQAVQIVIDSDEEHRTLAGHIDITRPLLKNEEYYAISYTPPVEDNIEEIPGETEEEELTDGSEEGVDIE